MSTNLGNLTYCTKFAFILWFITSFTETTIHLGRATIDWFETQSTDIERIVLVIVKCQFVL
jgi:hypothetical protein